MPTSADRHWPVTVNRFAATLPREAGWRPLVFALQGDDVARVVRAPWQEGCCR
jgi:hypothetical protein